MEHNDYPKTHVFSPKNILFSPDVLHMVSSLYSTRNLHIEFLQAIPLNLCPFVKLTFEHKTIPDCRCVCVRMLCQLMREGEGGQCQPSDYWGTSPTMKLHIFTRDSPNTWHVMWE